MFVCKITEKHVLEIRIDFVNNKSSLFTVNKENLELPFNRTLIET